MNITDINFDKKLENQLQFVIEIDKGYYTAGQSPAGSMRFSEASRGVLNLSFSHSLDRPR